MTFNEYLTTRRPRDNIQGDFVMDARRDRSFPEVSTWGELKSYLWFRSAGHAIEAARLVWAGYQATVRRRQRGYIRRDAISDWALGEYRRRYSDDSITKEDTFWYVYGILHSPEYKDRFASDLKKMVPRIPYAADFRAFSDAGRELGEWHLGYETVEPYPLEEESKRMLMEATDYRVHKMVFGKRGGEKDKSVIVCNPNLTLKGVPLNAYDYVVNGKSALDWVMERYAVSIHKESGIKNDPNDWSTDPHYIVDLVKRIVRVSVETVRIVATLPALGEQV